MTDIKASKKSYMSPFLVWRVHQMKALSILVLSLLVTPAIAWDGQDTDLGTNIMISSRSLATPGKEIIYLHLILL